MSSLSRRIARDARLLKPGDLPEAVIDKVKIGLLDMLSCAFEAQDLPWGCQAIQMASRASAGVASIIGTRFRVSPGDAAFVNATLGHGLVREDMHTGSVQSPGRGHLPDSAGAGTTYARERAGLHSGCGLWLRGRSGHRESAGRRGVRTAPSADGHNGATGRSYGGQSSARPERGRNGQRNRACRQYGWRSQRMAVCRRR